MDEKKRRGNKRVRERKKWQRKINIRGDIVVKVRGRESRIEEEAVVSLLQFFKNKV